MEHPTHLVHLTTFLDLCDLLCLFLMLCHPGCCHVVACQHPCPSSSNHCLVLVLQICSSFFVVGLQWVLVGLPNPNPLEELLYGHPHKLTSAGHNWDSRDLCPLPSVCTVHISMVAPTLFRSDAEYETGNLDLWSDDSSKFLALCEGP